MYYVYLLTLSNREYYAGSTSDLKNRIKAHKAGKVLSTKDLRPVKLIWYAAFENKKLAQDFEEYLKSSSGFSFRNKRLVK